MTWNFESHQLNEVGRSSAKRAETNTGVDLASSHDE
jgi:hypothetical protein